MGRTNVVLNEALIDEAMKITGAKTKKEVIHLALARIVDQNSLFRSIQKLRGKLTWDGNMDAFRKQRA